MDSNPNASPFLDIPPVVVAMAVIFGGVEVMFSMAQAGYLGGPGGVGWRINAIQDFGFFGEAQDQMLSLWQFPPDYMIRYLTYPFLHYSFTSALFVVVFILAIGKAISGAFSAWKLVLVFWAASIGGAFAFGALLEQSLPLISGFPGVYGWIGCFTFLLWVRAQAIGEAPLRAFSLIGFLLGIQLLFGMIFGSNGQWVADLAGFATGFLLAFVLIPGGWSRLRAQLRGR